ncbi:hypothetical protein BSIN_2788 [Burkholderia singularis]|uniref:Uncharacterized protein n=1 Tax=Burkholderia singularis TaxID=1503053 RepID=A0A238H3A4_9BURK|nr:hypothetical protein BSIN_2788 [Burkholderia singularis]
MAEAQGVPLAPALASASRNRATQLPLPAEVPIRGRQA